MVKDGLGQFFSAKSVTEHCKRDDIPLSSTVHTHARARGTYYTARNTQGTALSGPSPSVRPDWLTKSQEPMRARERQMTNLITRQDAARAPDKANKHDRISARPHDRRNSTKCQLHGCFSELWASSCS